MVISVDFPPSRGKNVKSGVILWSGNFGFYVYCIKSILSIERRGVGNCHLEGFYQNFVKYQHFKFVKIGWVFTILTLENFPKLPIPSTLVLQNRPLLIISYYIRFKSLKYANMNFK